MRLRPLCAFLLLQLLCSRFFVQPVIHAQAQNRQRTISGTCHRSERRSNRQERKSSLNPANWRAQSPSQAKRRGRQLFAHAPARTLSAAASRELVRARRAGIHAGGGRNANVGCALAAREDVRPTWLLAATAEPTPADRAGIPSIRDHATSRSTSARRFGSRPCSPRKQPARALSRLGPVGRRHDASSSTAEIRITRKC